MINPITQLLMTRRAELNAELARQEMLFRKGKISFELYSETTKRLIKVYHNYENDMSTVAAQKGALEAEGNVPKGLFGIIMRAIKKIF